jgi:hypothetical protein
MRIYLIKQISKYSNKNIIPYFSNSFSNKQSGINKFCRNKKCFSSSFNFKQSSIDNIMEESREDNYKNNSYQSNSQKNKRNRISFVRDGMILSFYLRQVKYNIKLGSSIR